MLNPSPPYTPAALVPRRIVADGLVPERAGVTVWWSSVMRDGDWILPRIFRAFAFMGNVEIDLTNARLGDGESEIEVRCIMANIEITVPREIRVICDGEGIAANFEITRIGETTPPPNAPTLRITGNAYLGSVSVIVKGPVGPGWKEKLVAGWKQLNS